MTLRPHTCLIPVLFLTLSVSACNAVVYVCAAAPGPAHDGNSWKTAYTALQPGIDDADAANEEVWVAKGTYSGPISTKAGANLYGGFAGTEAARFRRDWIANETIISGGLRIHESAAIDGFTITGAVQNEATAADSHIGRCKITGNGTGILVNSANGFTVHDCIISGNTDGVRIEGLHFPQDRIPSITSNTIVSNSRWGIASAGSSCMVFGNIVAFNGTGVIWAVGTAGPMLSGNCVYGNTTNYGGVSPGAGDFQEDPRFKDKDAGDYHLTASSPCLDRGYPQAAGGPDYEGSSRGQDANVGRPPNFDTGAYEYPADLMHLKELHADGTPVYLGGMCVTAVYPHTPLGRRFYIEREDRAAGIRVDMMEFMLEPGDRINVNGAIQTDATGERYISNPYVSITRGRGLPRPLGIPIRALVGTPLGLQGGVTDTIGMNNLGLYARIFGKVKSPSADLYHVDDGSGVPPGAILTGVKVLALGTQIPAAGEYTSVDGIISCEKVGSDLRRLLRAGGKLSVDPNFQAMACGPLVPTTAEGGILLVWNTTGFPSGTVQFHIWRDGATTPILGLSEASAVPISTPVGNFQRSVIDRCSPRSFTYYYEAWNETLGTTAASAEGVVRGTTHTYWWSELLEGITPTGPNYMETGYYYMGRATYLTPPIPVSPDDPAGTQPVDLSDVTFVWQGSKGANQYRIEVASTSSFEREDTWCADVDETTSMDGAPISQQFEDVLDQSPELSSLPPGTTLYWRIGARNTGDDPGPYPSGPSPLTSGVKHTRFLYSAGDTVLSFTIGGPPPPPP